MSKISRLIGHTPNMDGHPDMEFESPSDELATLRAENEKLRVERDRLSAMIRLLSEGKAHFAAKEALK